jgi:hypothetical protein
MAIKKNISANQTHLSPRNDGCRQPVAKRGAAARRVEVCSQHQTPHRQRRICTVNTAQAIPTINTSEVEFSESRYVENMSLLEKHRLIQRVLGVTLDQPADLLCEIAERMDRKRELNMEVVELDMIADGIDELPDDSILVVRDHWFDGFLASLNWWRQVSDMLLVSGDYKFGLRGPEFAQEPVFAHHREALLKLLDDTFAAFAPAWQEGCYFSADWLHKGEATRELLKRYRTFTRYVGAFAQERWPEVNMRALLNRA